jgi:hypothetical protein
MKRLQVIGLAGTNGSGKDTVGHLLVKAHGYMFVTVTDLLRAEAVRRTLKTERQVLRTISSQWRRELGLGVLVDKAIAEYEKKSDEYSGVVVASLRNPGEADRFGLMVTHISAISVYKPMLSSATGQRKTISHLQNFKRKSQSK